MTELQRQLIDLYASNELDSEAREALEAEAFGDPELAHDMLTLARTVEAIQSIDRPQLGEAGYERILQRLIQSGVEPRTEAPQPAFWQYQFPLEG